MMLLLTNASSFFLTACFIYYFRYYWPMTTSKHLRSYRTGRCFDFFDATMLSISSYRHAGRYSIYTELHCD